MFYKDGENLFITQLYSFKCLKINCDRCDNAFVVTFFKTMYNKTIIRFGFCDIQNNQGLGKGYQPQPSASADNPYLDYGKFNIRYNGPTLWNETDERFKILTPYSFKRELSLHFINLY